MESNPFPSLTREGWRFARPSERACRIFLTATSHAPQTRLGFGRASAIPRLPIRKLLILNLLRKDVPKSHLEFCSPAIYWIQVLGG